MLEGKNGEKKDSAAGLNISCCFCLCSALEEEGLDVSQPPQGHQQERLCLGQLELSAQLGPIVWVGGNINLTTASGLRD